VARARRRKASKSESAEKSLSATAIVGLAEKAQLKLFHSPLREPYASLWVKDHWETWQIKSPAFEEWLSAMCYFQHGGVPCQQTLGAARNTLAGRALFGGPEERVYVRLSGHKGAIYVDLGNGSWQAVRITREGWDIVSHVPVKFVRAPGMQAMPHPTDGGTIDDLRPLLNLPDEDQWKLAVSWLIGAFRPDGPFPILVVEGTHGSAKSSCAKMLRALVDPNMSPLRAGPTNLRDLAISAANSWCLGFDNLSAVRPALSDALCRLSTGGGFSTRLLYTDGGEKIFEGMRPMLLNGIDIGIERADLLDRTITLSLPPIAEEARQTESELWTRFEALCPSILGSVFDAVACALRRRSDVTLMKLPRMADFAIWVCAAEPALGWSEGSFLKAFDRNRADANAVALEGSSLVQPIVRIAERGPWNGTPTELLHELAEELDELGQRLLPKTPRQLSQELRRLAPNLPASGITVAFGKTSGNNSERVITISKSGDGATLRR